MTNQVVLVEDPDWRFRSPYPSGLFFNRNALSAVSNPVVALFIPKAPPWELYRDTFAGVYPVIEVSSQATLIVPPQQPYVLLSPKTNRLDPPEEDLRRFDHQVYFTIARYYIGQIIGYTVEVPDFNDHPWLEWVHPPASPESALYPYRRQVVPPNPYQIPILWGQPKPWPVTEELDSVFRRPDVGVLLPFARPTPGAITMPNLIGLDQQTAIGIILADGLIYLGSVYEDVPYWPESPPAPNYLGVPFGPTPPPPRGTVIGQWPLPGTIVQPLMTQVTLILSSGFNFFPGTDTSSSSAPNSYQGSTSFP